MGECYDDYPNKRGKEIRQEKGFSYKKIRETASWKIRESHSSPRPPANYVGSPEKEKPAQNFPTLSNVPIGVVRE